MKNKAAQELRAIPSQKRVEASKKNGALGGRPPKSKRKQQVTASDGLTIILEPEDVIRLREICKERGISQAGWIAEKIREEP